MRRASSLLLPVLLATPLAVLAGAAIGGPPATVVAAETARLAPAPVRVAREGPALQTAIFAGGCFWGVEGLFSHVRGVTGAVAGYHGGTRGDATYDRVSAGRTAHAEAVRVVYDPAQVRYDQLLRIFFSVVIDPTLRNRQGPDVGTQYRTALVPLTEEQRLVASAYIAQLGASATWTAPIATRVEPHRRFYPADAHHQDFMASNPRHPYIRRWDAPKVEALRRMFPGFYAAGFRTG